LKRYVDGNAEIWYVLIVIRSVVKIVDKVEIKSEDLEIELEDQAFNAKSRRA
jgi:hypothetical protein